MTFSSCSEVRSNFEIVTGLVRLGQEPDDSYSSVERMIVRIDKVGKESQISMDQGEEIYHLQNIPSQSSTSALPPQIELR